MGLGACCGGGGARVEEHARSATLPGSHFTTFVILPALFITILFHIPSGYTNHIPAKDAITLLFAKQDTA